MGKIFYKHKLENLINVDKIVTVHYLEYHKNYRFEGEAHDFWEFVYVDNGSVFCSVDFQPEFMLDKGELLFHRPNEFHTIRADGKTSANVFIVSFSSRSEAMSFFVQKRFSMKKETRNLLSGIISEAQNTFDLPLFNPDLKRLQLKKSPLPGGLQMLKIYIEQLLITLMRLELISGNDNKKFIPIDPSFDKLEEEIKRFLHDSVYKRITLDDLCREFNYSKTFLCMKFKEKTGYTVFSYYNKLKIDEAKALIRTTDYSLSHISDLLAFESYSYFTKTFKKSVGHSPRVYKGLLADAR